MGVAEVMGNLAASYLDEGRAEEGLALLERALSVMEQAGGKETPVSDPLFAKVRHCLGIGRWLAPLNDR